MNIHIQYYIYTVILNILMYHHITPCHVMSLLNVLTSHHHHNLLEHSGTFKIFPKSSQVSKSIPKATDTWNTQIFVVAWLRHVEVAIHDSILQE